MRLYRDHKIYVIMSLFNRLNLFFFLTWDFSIIINEVLASNYFIIEFGLSLGLVHTIGIQV